MPNCFQLLDKKTGEPVRLNTIDERLCDELFEPCRPREWLYGWYNYLGLGFALGRSMEEMKATFSDDEDLLRVLSILERDYAVRCWAER